VTGDRTASGSDHFAQAYHALRSDPSVQFNYAPPVKAPPPPHWLQAFFHWLGETLSPIGRALKWLGSLLPDAPYAKILLWTVIAIAAAALLWALYNRLRHGEWRIGLRRSADWREPEGDREWAPEEASARSWLEEADALAGQGRFAEAIHHLLFRSIEDIRRRRPAVVRPALTSRELAASNGIPGRARVLFAAIAGLVERSLFAGRQVDEGDWQDARGAYSDFALATAWRA
jgi:hypothetical protein